MEGIAITHDGLGELAKQEVESILKCKAVADDEVVTFPISKETDLCLLAYKARILRSVMLKLVSFKLSDLEDIKSNLRVDDLKRWLPEGATFAARCIREGDQDFSSNEIECEIGEFVSEKFGNKANLTNPDVTILAYYIDDDCHVGIDFAGIDLSKRSYKICATGDAMKGSVAQAMNYFAGIKKGMTILDPFTQSGVFPIEAVLYLSNKSPHYYDKDDFAFHKLPSLKDFDFDDLLESEDSKSEELEGGVFASDFLQRNVKNSEKNAKVAGVNRQISFSRMDIEWLDTKFEEGSVDRIITVPPQVSKRADTKQVLKIIDELLYASNLILKKSGQLVMIFNHFDELDAPLKKHGFKISEMLDLWQGQEHLKLLRILRA